MNRLNSKLAGLLLLALAIPSCREEITFEEQLETDKQIINSYVTEKNLNGEFLPEGVYVVKNKDGEGLEYPALSDTISIVYEGSTLDGNVFDSSQGDSVAFPLNRLIQGWQIGIPEFKKGGEGILIIPSGYAYGVSGSGPIPPNAVLRFDIALKDFY